MNNENGNGKSAGVLAQFVSEADIMLLFTGFALAGISNQVQLAPEKIGAHAVEIAKAATNAFIKQGLLPGILPALNMKELIARAQTGDIGAAKGLVESMVEEAKRQNVKGIPGDGTIKHQ